VHDLSCHPRIYWQISIFIRTVMYEAYFIWMTARTNSSIFKDKYFDGLENVKLWRTCGKPPKQQVLTAIIQQWDMACKILFALSLQMFSGCLSGRALVKLRLVTVNNSTIKTIIKTLYVHLQQDDHSGTNNHLSTVNT